MSAVQLELFDAAALGPDPRIGCQPTTAYEWLLLEALGHGAPVPAHPSACASETSCWHAKVWHRPGVRAATRHCMIPGCPCEAYVPREQPVPPWLLARRAAEAAR